MALAQKGLDVRQSGTAILVDAFFQDVTGALVTSGTTTVKVYEVQSDGTLKSFDFTDNTFKTTALGTETLALTHRTGNNATTNTGYWSGSVGTVSAFTIGGIYLFLVNNAGALPTDQLRKFQYAGAEGDLLVTAGSTGQATLQADTVKILSTTSAGQAGYVGLDWGQIVNKTTVNALTQTSVVQPSIPTAASIATTFWQDLTSSSDFTTSGSAGKLLVDNLNAAVTSRMATYTQPTGFLAATFPGAVASTTNITAATGITVATNSDKTGYTLTQSFPANFAALAITSGGIVQADLQTIKTQAVTAAAGVTFPTSIGTSTYAGGDTSGTTTLLARVTTILPSHFTNATFASDGVFAVAALANAPGLDAAGMRTAVGLATANLDTQFSTAASTLASKIPANLVMTSGKVWALSDTGNPLLEASAYTAAPSAATIAAAILVTPAHLLATAADGGVTLADGVAHGGTPGSGTATLALKQVYVFNTDDNAVYLASNTNAALRMDAVMGLDIRGQTAISLQSQSGGNAVYIYDQGSDAAIVIDSTGGTGMGLRIATAANHGIAITSAGTGKHDIALLGSADVLGSLTGSVATLGPNALDAILTTEPTIANDGAMSTWNFRKLLRWVIARFVNAGRTPSTITVKTLTNSTSTTQTITDDSAGTETTGVPS